MTKKNFDSIKTNNVYEAIEQSTGKRTHKTASAQEAAERRSNMKTQGRKGCKAIRINMAFTPENHDYIKVMSKIYGVSMTEYINDIISYYHEENAAVYEQAKKLQEKTKK